MSKLSRSFTMFVLGILVASMVTIFGCPQNQSDLESRVEALEAKLAHVSVEEASINGLSGPHIIIDGCNVHVRSGSGNTVDSLTGLGNLIIGYNEQPDTIVYGRLGAHNLVVGMGHEYASYSGFVAGFGNAVTGAACSVSGGLQNTASAFYSSVSGGRDNMAVGNQSSVSGGLGNMASGSWSNVSGGNSNEASGSDSASVSGGWLNEASGDRSSVSGGTGNTASGASSSVGGGNNRTAANTDDWIAGGLFEDN